MDMLSPEMARQLQWLAYLMMGGGSIGIAMIVRHILVTQRRTSIDQRYTALVRRL